jgi:o-succinylbenzoate synthase
VGIQQIEVYRVTLRYNEPFRIAAGESTEARNVVVKIVTDYDVTGWGESSPSARVTGETTESVVKFLDRVSPRLIHKCPLRTEQIVDLMDGYVRGNPAAKAAIEMALFDILGKTAEKPLYMLLGGFRSEVITDITLGIKPPERMAQDACKAVEQGFKALKVKLGVHPDEDFRRVKMIREAVGEHIQLRVDANQGWTVSEAIDVLNKIDKFRIHFAEQPVQADDIKGLRAVRRDSPIPIMADESVQSPEDAFRLIQAEAVDLINIKLMKCGGLSKGRRIAEIAEAAHLPCMIGCMSESGTGIAAAAHLAGGVRNIKYADLDSDLMLRDKLVCEGGVGLKDSARVFSKISGLGIERLDEGLLGKPAKIYR